jgi:hypothetical protein
MADDAVKYIGSPSVTEVALSTATLDQGVSRRQVAGLAQKFRW